MAVLRKRRLKNGSVFVVDFYHQGTRHRISAKTDDRKLATRVLREIEGKIVHGTFRLEDYDHKSIQLEEFFKEYFPFAEAHKSQETVINERNYARKFMSIVGPRRTLDSIDVRTLDKWKSELIKSVKPATFNIERRVLQGIFNIALKWGYIQDNPFCKVTKMKVSQRRLFLTDKELHKIIKLIVADIESSAGIQHVYNKKFLLLVLFLLNTGMRRSEALKLTKQANIDFERKLILLEFTKSKKTRIIPMNSVVEKIIGQLDDEMFSRMEKNSVTHKFKHYVRAAEFSCNFHLHSLRHTFATRLVLNKKDIYTVSLLLGHADIRTSMIYAKQDMDVLRGAVNLIESGHDLVTLKEDGE